MPAEKEALGGGDLYEVLSAARFLGGDVCAGCPQRGFTECVISITKSHRSMFCIGPHERFTGAAE